MKDSGFGSFLAGVVIGGLIGAALGLLLAPQTGDEFREHVGDFVDGKRAEWEDAVNEGKRRGRERARRHGQRVRRSRGPGPVTPTSNPRASSVRAGGRRLSVVNGR